MNRNFQNFLLLAALIIVMGHISVATNQTETTIYIDETVNDCLLFVEKPPLAVPNGTKVELKSANWNCGTKRLNVTFYSLSILEEDGNIVKSKSVSDFQLGVGENRLLGLEWVTEGFQAYEARIRSEFRVMIDNETVTKEVAESYIFSVYWPNRPGEGGGGGGGGGGASRKVFRNRTVNRTVRKVLSIDLKLPEDIISLNRGESVAVQAVVENNGNKTLQNLKVEVFPPDSWRKTTAFVESLGPGKSVSREIMIAVNEEARP
ncbi:MAG: NEW3 domain-containing protein, partial [Candidatus Aenigmatarchaeota archaeon]